MRKSKKLPKEVFGGVLGKMKNPDSKRIFSHDEKIECENMFVRSFSQKIRNENFFVLIQEKGSIWQENTKVPQGQSKKGLWEALPMKKASETITPFFTFSFSEKLKKIKKNRASFKNFIFQIF